MTLPYERTRAVLQTARFLETLCQPRLTPKVPREIREQAFRCLRHYPWALHMKQSAKAAPDVWGVVDSEPRGSE